MLICDSCIFLDYTYFKFILLPGPLSKKRKEESLILNEDPTSLTQFAPVFKDQSGKKSNLLSKYYSFVFSLTFTTRFFGDQGEEEVSIVPPEPLEFYNPNEPEPNHSPRGDTATDSNTGTSKALLLKLRESITSFKPTQSQTSAPQPATTTPPPQPTTVVPQQPQTAPHKTVVHQPTPVTSKPPTTAPNNVNILTLDTSSSAT